LRLDAWLQSVCTSEIARSRAADVDSDTHYLSAAFDLLCQHRIAAASQLVADNGDVRLAVLIAGAGAGASGVLVLAVMFEVSDALCAQVTFVSSCLCGFATRDANTSTRDAGAYCSCWRATSVRRHNGCRGVWRLRCMRGK
jgi:hypothetical protein